jgi:hypothetical protein
MRRSALLLFSTTFLLVGKPGTGEPAPADKFEVGQAFPDIVLPSLSDGHPSSLSQFRGKKVLLHIFASW